MEDKQKWEKEEHKLEVCVIGVSTDSCGRNSLKCDEAGSVDLHTNLHGSPPLGRY